MPAVLPRHCHASPATVATVADQAGIAPAAAVLVAAAAAAGAAGAAQHPGGPAVPPDGAGHADPGVTTGAAVAVYQAAVAAMCARAPDAGNTGSLCQPADTAGTPAAEQSDRIPAGAAGTGRAARDCAEIVPTSATGAAVAE